MKVIQDVDLALEDLENFHHANRAAVEGLADRNGHITEVVGEGKKSVG